MPVFGLTGPNASGKGEVCAYLGSRGFRVVSLSDIIREELAHRGVSPTREAMIETGTALRKRFGAGVLAERLLHRLGDREVVDSVRNPTEVAVLRRIRGFKLVLVDAPPELRFERCRRRDRIGDAQDLGEFLRLEARENSADPAGQQLEATATMADLKIFNEGSDLAALHEQIDRVLGVQEENSRKGPSGHG